MKLALVIMLMMASVAVSMDTSDKWSCASGYTAKLQQCVAKFDEGSCKKFGVKLLECFDWETKDYNMALRTGHGARIIVGTDTGKINQYNVLDYPVDPFAASSSAYTLLKGDVKGFVIIITGERTTLKTKDVDSWMNMIHHNTKNKPLYAKTDRVQIDADFSKKGGNKFLTSLTDNERSYAEEEAVVIPGDSANSKYLNARLPHKIVLANAAEDASGNHFLEMVALLSPTGDPKTYQVELLMGDIEHCSKCSEILKESLKKALL